MGMKRVTFFGKEALHWSQSLTDLGSGGVVKEGSGVGGGGGDGDGRILEMGFTGSSQIVTHFR